MESNAVHGVGLVVVTLAMIIDFLAVQFEGKLLSVPLQSRAACIHPHTRAHEIQKDKRSSILLSQVVVGSTSSQSDEFTYTCPHGQKEKCMKNAVIFWKTIRYRFCPRKECLHLIQLCYRFLGQRREAKS